MLRELRVRNFAIVEDGALVLGAGETAFTGETGAGKSLLLDAITLLLGAKAKSDLVREGSKSAEVEGVFDLSKDPEKIALAEELGFSLDPDDGNVLLVRREISAHDVGKNRIWIQGRSATRAQLQELLGNWVEVSGQHEFLRLGNQTYILSLIDQFGGLKNEAKDVASDYANLEEAKKLLLQAEQSEANRDARLDYLRFQIEEFEKAGISPESPAEEEKLVALRARLGSLEKITSAGSIVRTLLDGGDGTDPRNCGIMAGLQGVLRELRPYENMGEDFSLSIKMAESASQEIAELSRVVDRVLSSLEADPEALESAEHKLSAINRLKRKYNTDTAGLLLLKNNATEEVDALSSHEGRLEQLRKNVNRLTEKLSVSAVKLHERRTNAAAVLQKAWEKDIRLLGMQKARLELKMELLEEFSASGVTQAQAMFSANAGESLKPLGKVASGGELSRIMLALKNLVAGRAEIGVYLFDEVDAGIGGETAQIVGARLRSLASDNQVLVVTHLAQIAAKAHRQFRIQKQTERGRTRTIVAELQDKDRELELARMLGDTDSKAALGLARELLKRANDKVTVRIPEVSA